MNRYLSFERKMKPFGVFSIVDIEKSFPGFVRQNLVNWQKEGHILKIRRGWYCLTEANTTANLPWLAANLIYAPSYISLESALSYYALIPEAVYTTTSVSTRKTYSLETPLGHFSYQSLQPSYFGFGQRLIRFSQNAQERPILIAEAEKAILDYFYLNPQLQSPKDMEYLRFDVESLNLSVSKEKLFDYLERFKSAALESRLRRMLDVYHL
jgi:predicted transcriptional regulator of viral defense system